MTLPIKKIFAISLAQKKKYKGYAVYNGEQLVFQVISPIKGPFSEWKDALIEEIEERKKRGFIVLIEERTEHFSQYATQFSFEGIDPEEGRVNYYVALDWYFALENMGNLVLPPDSQNHAIRENKVDRMQDEKGRTKYVIEWDRFTGAQRVILLCVMAAVGMNPISDVYLDEFFEGLDDDVLPNNDPYKSFKAVTVGYDITRGKKLDAERKLSILKRTKHRINEVIEDHGQTEPI